MDVITWTFNFSKYITDKWLRYLCKKVWENKTSTLETYCAFINIILNICRARGKKCNFAGTDINRHSSALARHPDSRMLGKYREILQKFLESNFVNKVLLEWNIKNIPTEFVVKTLKFTARKMVTHNYTQRR